MESTFQELSTTKKSTKVNLTLVNGTLVHKVIAADHQTLQTDTVE